MEWYTSIQTGKMVSFRHFYKIKKLNYFANKFLHACNEGLKTCLLKYVLQDKVHN